MRTPLFALLSSLLSACGGAAPEPSAAPASPAATSAAVQPAPSAPADIDVATLKQRLDAGGTFVLDVRTPQEFAQGHVPGAVNISLQELASRLPELEARKGEEFAVICAVGGRSASATALLREQGFAGATNVQGGTQAWIQAGLPVE